MDSIKFPSPIFGSNYIRNNLINIHIKRGLWVNTYLSWNNIEEEIGLSPEKRGCMWISMNVRLRFPHASFSIFIFCVITILNLFQYMN